MHAGRRAAVPPPAPHAECSWRVSVPCRPKSFAKEITRPTALTGGTGGGDMRRNSWTVTATAWMVAACGGGDGGGNNGRGPDVNPGLPASLSVVPENTGDGWIPSTPAAEGMSATELQGTLELIRDQVFTKVDSMVVARHGR